MTNNGWENTTNEIKDRAVPPLEPGQFICELQASYSRTSLCQYWREQLLDFDLGNYSTFQDNITPRCLYMLLDIFGCYPFYYSKADICCHSTLVVGGDKKVRLPLFVCYIYVHFQWLCNRLKKTFIYFEHVINTLSVFRHLLIYFLLWKIQNKDAISAYHH
jgi:hypothetical protein